MINTDFQDLSSYRTDGRRPEELRTTSITLGVNSTADGSCILKQGLTEVLCIVYGPNHRTNSSDPLLKIQYTVAPFSLDKRKSKYDKQFIEFTENVRKSFEATIVEQNYKRSQIEVIVTVLQNEGSAKSVVMNCMTLALVNAGICMKDLLLSCTISTLEKVQIVDPNEEEEYDCTNVLVLSYLPQIEKIDCFDLKKAKIKEKELSKIYELGKMGCNQLNGKVRQALKDYCYKKMLIF